MTKLSRPSTEGKRPNPFLKKITLKRVLKDTHRIFGMHFEVWNYSYKGLRGELPLDVVFLHGFLGEGSDFHQVGASFAELFGRPVRLIFVDLPGHGSSEGRELTNMHQLYEDFYQIHLKLMIRTPLYFAYSMGGRFCLHFLQEFALAKNIVHPSGLVLESVGLGHPEQDSEARAKRRELDQKVASKLESAVLKDFLQDWYSMDLFQGTVEAPSFPELLKKRTNTNEGREKYLSEWPRRFGQGQDQHTHLTPVLEQILANSVPITYLAGELDSKYALIGAGAEVELNSENFAFQKLPFCSHAPHFDNPELVAEVWANSLSLSRRTSSL